jgi:spermidine/putrescine transport system substrate-binding protein
MRKNGQPYRVTHLYKKKQKEKRVMKKLFTVFTLFLFTFMLASCEQGETLKLFIWGEYIDEEIVKAFEDEYGVNVDIILFDSNEIALTQIKANSFDVIVPSDYAIEELASQGLLTEIDWDRITDFSEADMSEDYVSLLSQVEGFDILNYSVPYFWGNIGLIYDTRAVSQSEVEAAGWDIMKRQDLRVMFYDISRDSVMIALRALYGQDINPDQATDEELVAAEQWLLDARGPRTRYLTTEIYDVFLDPGVIDVAAAFSGEAIFLLPEVETLGWYVPHQGTNVWMDMLAIPKNAENPDLAYQFINYMMSYEVALANSQYIGYTSPRQDVVDYIIENEEYGPEYAVEIRPYDHIHRYNTDLKIKIEQLWSRIRAN